MFKTKVLLLVVLSPILLILTLSTLFTGLTYDNVNIRYQEKHLEYLKTEYYTELYTPCDEHKLADFNIAEAYSDGTKLNELTVIGTHNSYQLLTYFPRRALHGILYYATSKSQYDKYDFEMDTLTQQLENGVRKLEIDIETVDDGEIRFIVTHDPITDNVSSCYDFEKALEEIKMWSDNNPDHLPITVMIEPKKYVPAVNNMKSFKIEYANEFDKIIREKMGDSLLTPNDMMGKYESLKEMRENDGWLPLEKTMGKVIFLLHESNVTEDYIKQDESVKSQAMFPMLRYEDRDKSYASFILDNKPHEALEHEEELIGRCNLIVRTRADSYPECTEERYASANESKAQIITTDYPMKTRESKYHIYSFDGYTVKLQK